MDRANQIHACVSRSWKFRSAIIPNVFGAIVNLFVTRERSSGVFSSRRPRRDGGTMRGGYATVLHMQDQRRNMQMQKSANEDWGSEVDTFVMPSAPTPLVTHTKRAKNVQPERATWFIPPQLTLPTKDRPSRPLGKSRLIHDTDQDPAIKLWPGHSLLSSKNRSHPTLPMRLFTICKQAYRNIASHITHIQR
jgi:hypothetical protein